MVTFQGCETRHQDMKVAPTCPVCGPGARAFTEYDGGHFRCSGCGSVETQRVFATIYETIRREFDLARKDILVVRPSFSELRFLRTREIKKIRSIDIRPETKPDILGDICDMSVVADSSFDAILAISALTHAQDLEGCLSEFHRVLRPGGWLLTSDSLRVGARTEEFHDIERIASWYGRYAYDRYRIGTFRALGDLDILDILGTRFAVKTFSGDDLPSGKRVVWYVSIKSNESAALSSKGEEVAEGQVFVEDFPPITSSLRSGKPSGRLSLSEPFSEVHVTHCPFCGDPLHTVNNKGDCPSCGQHSRTRSLAPILADVVRPLLPSGSLQTLPLLAFAMTAAEQTLIEPIFPSWRSVSLFGTYRTDHETGVDARDLSRYDQDCFAGVFSIQLFDFFPEHEQALQEMYRVLAPGGVLFTLIAGYRLRDDVDPPHLDKILETNAGYFAYWPTNRPLPSVKVGRAWFVDAMRRVGFEADLVQVKDDATGETLDWFIGQKPGRTRHAAQEAEHDNEIFEPLPSAPTASSEASKPALLDVQAPKVLITQQTPAYSKIYSTPVDPSIRL